MFERVIEGVITGVVVAILTFGGKFLGHYLKRKFPWLEDRSSAKSVTKSARKGKETARIPEAEPEPQEAPSQAAPRPRTSPVQPALRRLPLPQTTTIPTDFLKRIRKQPPREEYAFYFDWRYWISSILIIGIGIGMAFLAAWMLSAILGIFDYEPPAIDGIPLVLSIVGIIWGITYIVSGTSLITDWYEVAFAVVEPYGEFFDSFLTTIMVALPFNILIAWGIANGIGIAVEIFFENGYQIAVYVVLGIVTLIQLWIMNEEYIYL